MYLDVENGFAFIHIPKTAGTSVIRALRGDGSDVDHGLKGLKDADSLLRCCFVRDPMTRFVSAFRYSAELARRKDGKFITRRHPARQLIVDQDVRTVDDFVAAIEPKGADWLFKNIHFRPQIEWVSPGRPQFIGRFESLGADFERLCRAIGLENRSLEHYRRSRTARPAGPGKASTQLVREWYADDYRLLGY